VVTECTGYMGDNLGPNGWALHDQSFVRALVLKTSTA